MHAMRQKFSENGKINIEKKNFIISLIQADNTM